MPSATRIAQVDADRDGAARGAGGAATGSAIRVLNLIGGTRRDTAACLSLAALAWFRRRRERAATALLNGFGTNAPVGLGFIDGRARVWHSNLKLDEIAGVLRTIP